MINKSRRMEGHSVRPIEVLVYGLLDEFVLSEKKGRAETGNLGLAEDQGGRVRSNPRSRLECGG